MMKNDERYFSMSVISFGKEMSNVMADVFKVFRRSSSVHSEKNTNKKFLRYVPNYYKKVALGSLTKQGIKTDYRKTGGDLFKALNDYEHDKGLKQTKRIKFSE